MRIISYLLSSIFVLIIASPIYAGNPVTEDKVKELLLTQVNNDATLKGDTGAVGDPLTVTEGTGGIAVASDLNTPPGHTISYAPTIPDLKDTVPVGGGTPVVVCTTITGGIKNLAVAVILPTTTKPLWDSITTATGATSMISGLKNSNLVIHLNLGTRPAFVPCSALMPANSWYLPSLEELQCMRSNSLAGKIDSIDDTLSYWSSTEDSTAPANAFSLNFADKSTTSQPKTTATNNVLCVHEIVL